MRCVILGNNKNAFVVARLVAPLSAAVDASIPVRIIGMVGAYIDWEFRDHLASLVESIKGVIGVIGGRKKKKEGLLSEEKTVDKEGRLVQV